MNRIALWVGGALLALMFASSTMFIVDQRQFAVLYALGEIKEVITVPGLKFKLPPPFQNVVFLDRRVQTLDSPETRPIFTAEKNSLVIDWLIKWRIIDARQFIRNNGVDIRNLEARLAPVVTKLNIIRVWSGVEGYMPDDLPVMGPSATTPGLHYAFGFCGAGFQIGPGVGETMAELIATGATNTPIAPFSIARYATPAQVPTARATA